MLFLPLFAALSPTEVVVDTLKNFDIEEAVVVASPKETKQLRKQPLSVSLFDASSLKHRNVSAVKDLSAYAPNFFMPDYGSRLTSACYIRGIGSRINTPAVGLYVDNVPYADKSAYDFHFKALNASTFCEVHKAHFMDATPWADCYAFLLPTPLHTTGQT